MCFASDPGVGAWVLQLLFYPSELPWECSGHHRHQNQGAENTFEVLLSPKLILNPSICAALKGHKAQPGQSFLLWMEPNFCCFLLELSLPAGFHPATPQHPHAAPYFCNKRNFLIVFSTSHPSPRNINLGVCLLHILILRNIPSVSSGFAVLGHQIPLQGSSSAWYFSYELWSNNSTLSNEKQGERVKNRIKKWKFKAWLLWLDWTKNTLGLNVWNH